jgi:hypothetical protein
VSVTFENHNPPDWDYELATLEENIAGSREILQRLYGFKTPMPELDSEGECEDRCGRCGFRVHLGRFLICRPCAIRRLKAERKAA